MELQRKDDGGSPQPETLKFTPEKFGGDTPNLMRPEDVQARMCVAKYCGRMGFTQMSVPGLRPRYWILCRHHSVVYNMVVALALGHPSPIEFTKGVAELFGVDWSAFLRYQPQAQPIKPDEFRCILCGGDMQGVRHPVNPGREYRHYCEGETEMIHIQIPGSGDKPASGEAGETEGPDLTGSGGEAGRHLVESISPKKAATVRPMMPEERLRAIIGQAIGAGSACWQDVGAAGIFDDVRAAKILDETIAALKPWIEPVPIEDVVHGWNSDPDNLLENALTLIANVGATHGVSFHDQGEDWARAALRFRDLYHEYLRIRATTAAPVQDVAAQNPNGYASDPTMDLNRLADMIHRTAVQKGWWSSPDRPDIPVERNFGEIIALIHSEVSEAMEAYREGSSLYHIEFEYPDANDRTLARTIEGRTDVYHEGGWLPLTPELAMEKGISIKPVGVIVEMADIIIRVLDWCGSHEVDISKAMREKMTYNEQRPFRHGNKLA